MKKFIALGAAVILSLGLISWGTLGHHVVGEIAERHLTPEARAGVSSLLGHESLAGVSSWADEILTDNRETAPLHFINLPLGLTFAEFQQRVTSQNGNAYSAILTAVSQLKSSTTSRTVKTHALKFLVHFVGDVHQPMHVSRAEDRGGNSIMLTYNNEGTNLHALWDTRLLEQDGSDYHKLADLYDHATPQQIQKWQSDPVIIWVWESYQISTLLYHEVEGPDGVNLGKDYYDSHIPIVRRRIEEAGIRLAGLLNAIYKTNANNADAEFKASPYILPAKNAAKHIGVTASFSGKVYSHKNMGGFVIVNIGADYPNQQLTVLLKGNALSLAGVLDGKTIVVTGKVIEYNGKPEIEVTDQHQIQLPVNDNTAGKMKDEAGPR